MKYTIFGLIVGLLAAVYMFAPKAEATYSHREWGNWSNYSAWSECEEGTKVRTKTRVCELHSGFGYSECSYVGQVDTHHDYEKCTVPTPTPEPTPEPTPTPTPVHIDTTHGNGGPQLAPSCTDGSTIFLPAGFQVLRSGESAKLMWFQTQADQVNVFYKEVGQADWTHGVGDIPAKVGQHPNNFNEFTVQGLKPLGYIFGLMQKHGCGGGQMVTAVVVDGPESQLFPFSYWQWEK